MATVGRAEVKIVADARGFARDAERTINREIDRIDVDTTKINRDIDRNTTRGFIAAAQNGLTQFGIILQGGISRSAAGAFGAAVLAVLIPGMAVVGAAAAGALVLAFGAGIAGIGIIAAAQNEEVAQAFEDLKDDVVGTLKELAAPFEPALIEIAELFGDTFDAFAPALGAAFKALAPAIVSFSKQLATAFLTLRPAIEPLIDAFIVLLEEIGPQLAEEIFPDLADALINLADAVSENSDIIADIIGWFLQAAEATINFIAELTRLAGWFADNPAVLAAGLAVIAAGFIALGIAATGGLGLIVIGIIALGTLLLAFKDDIANIWNEIVRRFQASIEVIRSWLASFGAAVQALVSRVVDHFQNMASGVRTVFNRVVDFVRSMGRGIRAGFNAIVSFVRSIPGRIASAASGMWNSIVSSFKSAINGIIGAWNSLSFTLPAISAFGKTLGGSTVGTPNIPFLQQGGIINEAGAVRVGDGGPETLFLPEGAVVAPLDSNLGGMPATFEAVAIIDLGRGIKERITLEFRDIRRDALSGAGRQVGRAF